MFSGTTTSSPDLSQKTALQIKQDDKFFSRLLSKESSSVANSFRVYHGGLPGAVPFLWESQPGTPKHILADTSLPPLTPPPSFYFKSNSSPVKKRTRSGLLHALFPKMSFKKNNDLSSSPSSNSQWSSSHLLIFPSSTHGKYNGRSRFSTPRLSFDSRADDEDPAVGNGSPTSPLCFSLGRSGVRGCYGW